MLDIAFAKPTLPKSGALVLLVGEDQEPSGVWLLADQATGGAVSRAIASTAFKGGKGKSVTIPGPGAGLSRIVLYGMGKCDGMTLPQFEDVGGSAFTTITTETTATISAGGLPPAEAAAVAMGGTLRSYRFDRYRTKEKAEDKPKLSMVVTRQFVQDLI